MKIIRKTSAILLAMVLCLFIFAGCTNANDQLTTAVATTAGKENTTAALPKTDSKLAAILKAKVGDIVNFGSYVQDKAAANGKVSITWKVLAIENGKVLMISEMVLDSKPYNDVRKNTTWETCTLRRWLNNEFLESAFNLAEQSAISLTSIENKANAEYKTSGGSNTQDNVFCLSIDEAKMYFKTDEARNTKSTAYAEAQGAYTYDYTEVKNNNFKEKDAGWWLRSPGKDAQDASDVYYNGIIHYDYVDYSKYIGVRPAMWIDLKSDIFKVTTPSTTAVQSSTTASSSTAAASTTSATSTTAPGK